MQGGQIKIHEGEEIVDRLVVGSGAGTAGRVGHSLVDSHRIARDAHRDDGDRNGDDGEPARREISAIWQRSRPRGHQKNVDIPAQNLESAGPEARVNRAS